MKQEYRRQIDVFLNRARGSKHWAHVVRWQGWLSQRPRFKAVSPILFGLIAELICEMTYQHYGFIYRQPLWLAPVPLFYFLYLKRIDGETPIYRPASEHFAILCASGFFVSIFSNGLLHLFTLFAGIVGGMFVFVDYRALRSAAKRHVTLAATAVAGALSGVAYYWTQAMGWKTLAVSTLNTVRVVLAPFIDKLHVFAKPIVMAQTAPPPHIVFHRFVRRVPIRVPGQPHPAPPAVPAIVPHPAVPAPTSNLPYDYMAMASDHLTLRVGPFQNIGIGIFLFLFVLSLELTLSRREISPKRFAAYAFGGAFAMFVINALAVAGFFAITNSTFASQPRSETMMFIVRTLDTFYNNYTNNWPSLVIVCYGVAALVLVRLLVRKPVLFEACGSQVDRLRHLRHLRNIRG